MNKEIKTMSNKQLAIGLSEMLEQHIQDQKELNEELIKVHCSFSRMMKNMNQSIDRLQQTKLEVNDKEFKQLLEKAINDLKTMDHLLVKRQKIWLYGLIYLLAVLSVLLLLSVVYLLLL